MPSAVAFLPPYMSVLQNLVMSLSLNLGSGMIRRLGTSRRRDMATPAPLRLRPLHAVLRALAVPVDLVRGRRPDGTRRVERAADHVVANARQVLHAGATEEHAR